MVTLCLVKQWNSFPNPGQITPSEELEVARQIRRR